MNTGLQEAFQLFEDALGHVVAGHDLDRLSAADAMRRIMEGEVSPVLVSSFLTALRVKGETPAEVAGMADAMRAAAIKVPGELRGLIDTCGTGGDRSNTFNISTAAAFVVAAGGLRVAKHGNRSATSKSGGADVLEALGVKIDLSPERAAQCLAQIGIAFLFAPLYHPAVKFVAPVRKELPFPTAFNILGPLCNPASPDFQVLGVFRKDLQDLVAGALVNLGIERAFVVHGDGGLDEIALSGPTRVLEVRALAIREFEITPREAGLDEAPRSALAGGDATHNSAIIRAILAGEAPGARTDVVLLNAGAAFVVGGSAPDIRSGVEMAREVLYSGAAGAKLDALIAASNSLS